MITITKSLAAISPVVLIRAAAPRQPSAVASTARNPVIAATAATASHRALLSSPTFHTINLSDDPASFQYLASLPSP